MKFIQCAICGKKERLRELFPATFNANHLSSKTFSARRTPDRMHYRFVKCQRCGFIFSNPILGNKKIVTLYSKSKFTYPIESSFLKKTYGGYMQVAIKGMKTKNLKLLDIGCGNGFFLEEAKLRGVKEVYGVEPGKDMVKNAPDWFRKRIKISILKRGLFKKNTFDMITCFHTLDHIIDPNEFLETVHDLLKPGGKVLFIVHNTQGLSVRLFGEKSPIFDIEHIFLFSKKTLSQLFRLHHFSHTHTFDVINTYPLSYWTRMIPLPPSLKRLISKSMNFFHLSSIPFSLQAGNIGIIAQK